MIDPNKLPQGGIWIAAEESDSDWLLVALHGSEGSSKDFLGMEEIFALSRMNYLYLNGPIRSYSGFRWYSDLGSREAAYRAIGDALDYASSQGYPANRTFLLGFSQGASLAIECGARYPHLLAGYISISGRIENLPGLLSHGLPAIIHKGRWLVTHGTRDFNLSAEVMHSQVEKLTQAGFRIDYREYDKIHEFDAANELPAIGSWIKNRME